MQTSKILTGIGVLIVVVGIGLGIGWLATRSTEPVPSSPVPVTSTATEMQPASPPRTTATRQSVPLPAASERTNLIRADLIPAQPLPPVANNIITNWEDRLDEILSNDDEDTNKVTELLSMFPRLPAEGQDEVAQHLSNLVEDEDYARLKPLALDPKLPEEVLDTLLADLLNRPNETKLPMFLDIAFTPDHPKSAEARELLELYLDEDFGTDRAVWQNKMQEWLKDNPD